MNEELWTALETRVRKLIKSLMEPGMVKMRAAEENSKKVMEFKEVLRKKLKRLKSKIISIEEKMPNNDKLNKIFMDLSLQYNFLEIQVKKDQQIIKNSVSTVAETVDQINEQMPSIVNQVAFLKKEVNMARKDFLRIRDTLESCIQVNIEEFNTKTRESLKNFEEINEKCVRVQKTVEHLSDSLCRLETKEALGWKTCAESHETVEKALESQKKSEEKIFLDIQNLKLEMKQWEKCRKDEQIKEKEEKIKENEGFKTSLMAAQETRMFKFLDFVLTDSKHKKKIAELKHRSKQNKAGKKEKLEDQEKNQEVLKDVLKNDEKQVKLEKFPENDEISNIANHIIKKSESSCLFPTTSKTPSRPFRSYSVSLDAKFFQNHSKSPKNHLKPNRQEPEKSVQKLIKRSSKVSQSKSSVSKSHHSVKFFRTRKFQKSSETLSFNHLKLSTTPKMKNSGLHASRVSRLSRHRFSSIRLETETVEINSSDSESNSLNNQPDLFDEIEFHFESLENQLFLLKNEVQQGLFPKINDLESVFHSYVNENKGKYEDIYQLIDTDLKPWVLNSLSSNIEEAVQSIKQVTSAASQKMQEMYEELEFNLQESIKELNSSILIKRREVSDLALQVKKHEKNIARQSDEITVIESDLAEIKNCYDKLKDSMISVNALLKQDEIDKKTLSLLAVKSNKQVNRKRNPVGLEKNCISCTSNVAQVLPAFKVACLAYNSSPVQVNDRVASRIEILDDQFEILNSMPRSLTPIGKKRSFTPDLPKVVINQRQNF